MWKKYRAKPGERIPLGRSGEHLARTIVFDISSWEQNYGEGVVSLLHQRRGDTAPYPVNIVQDGDIVRWTVTEADNAVSGTGRAELQYMVGDVVVKSEMYYTVTKPSIGASTGETPPAPEKPWVDEVLRYRNEAKEYAEDAAEAIDEAAGEVAEKSGEEGAKAVLKHMTVSGEHKPAGEAVPAVEKQLNEDGSMNLHFLLSTGVYVGSGEMPEDCNVQIDPMGDSLQPEDLKGKDGYTPVRGVDYWTDEDKDEIKKDVLHDINGCASVKDGVLVVTSKINAVASVEDDVLIIR